MRDDRQSAFAVRLHTAGRRLAAAEGIFRGRMEEFYASLAVGSDRERREVREGVLAAHEALLDAHEFNAWVLLERDGIDPMRRNM